MRKSILMFVITLVMTLGLYGQSPTLPKGGSVTVIIEKGGSVTVIIEKVGTELTGCLDGSDTYQLILIDEFGNTRLSDNFTGDTVELNVTEINKGTSLILISGDCTITKLIK